MVYRLAMDWRVRLNRVEERIRVGMMLFGVAGLATMHMACNSARCLRDSPATNCRTSRYRW
jgi:hypothetical protein